MVRIAVRERLADRIGHAGHACLAVPVERGQRFVCIEAVAFEVPGHLHPVDAAHVFAPAKHLPYEALSARDRHRTRAPRGFCGSHHLARREQLAVQCRGDMRMPQPRLARPERILEAPEVWQTFAYEGIQRTQRIRASHGPAEIPDTARVRGEAGFHQCDHLLRDRIGRHAQRHRHIHRSGAAEALAVVGVEVPLPAGGFAAIHKHAVATTHLAVEVFHPQLLAPGGVCREIAYGGVEVPVIAELQRKSCRRGYRAQ